MWQTCFSDYLFSCILSSRYVDLHSNQDSFPQIMKELLIIYIDCLTFGCFTSRVKYFMVHCQAFCIMTWQPQQEGNPCPAPGDRTVSALLLSPGDHSSAQIYLFIYKNMQNVVLPHHPIHIIYSLCINTFIHICILYLDSIPQEWFWSV